MKHNSMVHGRPRRTWLESVGRPRRTWLESFGRPRRTWLESVEVDIAELQIDKEDVHDRKKWRENIMKKKSNPNGKWTIN